MERLLARRMRIASGLQVKSLLASFDNLTRIAWNYIKDSSEQSKFSIH